MSIISSFLVIKRPITTF